MSPPDLTLTKPDGSSMTRVEAEKELWDKCKTSHMMRRLAWGTYGLDKRHAWMLKPTSVTHWILDELVRKKKIAGEQIGVQPELETEDSYFNSFTQRLKVFVEEGRALMPKEGEGIDMSQFENPPPPNGQPVYPAPPMGQPGGFAPPAPPMMAAPGAPQTFQPPPGAPPPMPQFGAVPPSFPPQGPPAPVQLTTFPPQAQQAPQMPPQQMQPPANPPAQAPKDRRKKSEGAPQMPPLPGGPQGMLPPAQPMPSFGAPPQQAPQMPAFGQQPTMAGVQTGNPAAIDELRAQVAAQGKQIQELTKLLRGIDAVCSVLIRGYYGAQLPQQASQLSVEATFKEINLPYPT